MTVGKDQEITVKSKGAGGQGKVGAKVTGPSGKSVPCKVEPGLSPETSQVRFIPRDKGPYEVELTYDGAPIPGSPFPVEAIAPTDPSKVRQFRNPGIKYYCRFNKMTKRHQERLFVGCLLGLDQNIRLFEYSFGGLAFDFQFEIRISFFFFSFFFFETPGIPRETVLNLSAWLNICTSNRPFANERRSCWPIACIYFMKNLLLAKRACRTSTFEIMNLSAQKTRHVNGLCYHKTNVIHAFSLSTVPRCEWKSWISMQ